MRIQHKKIINPLTGVLMTAPGLTINKATSSDDILEAYATDKVAITDMKNGWKHYTTSDGASF